MTLAQYQTEDKYPIIYIPFSSSLAEEEKVYSLKMESLQYTC